MLNITKTTASGRFTVTIQSAPIAGGSIMNTDAAKELKELSDLLIVASQAALGIAVHMLERPPAVDAVGLSEE